MKLKHFLPTTNWGDNLVLLWRFAKRHKRLPRELGGVNDELFKIAASRWLLEPLVQVCTDKEHAKMFIQALVGSRYIPKTYSVLHSPLDVYATPSSIGPCIFKATHGCEMAHIHHNSGDDIPRETLLSWFNKSFYSRNREKNYKHLPAKIIVEELLTASGSTPPPDYKVICIHGEPVFFQVNEGRWRNPSRTHYSIDWKRLNLFWETSMARHTVSCPRQLEEMLELSQVLSSPFGRGMVRVDFYIADQGLKVGELTFLTGGTRDRMLPVSADILLGEMMRADRTEIPRLRQKLVEICARYEGDLPTLST